MIENLKKDPKREYREDGDDLEKLFLNAEEWLAVDELIGLSKPFATATTIIGGSFYPTLSITFPIIIRLIEIAKKCKAKSKNLHIQRVAEEIYNNMKDRW